jgi:hypothetical protein
VMFRRWRIHFWSALGAIAGYAFSNVIAPNDSLAQIFLLITTSAGLHLVLSGLLRRRK